MFCAWIIVHVFEYLEKYKFSKIVRAEAQQRPTKRTWSDMIMGDKLVLSQRDQP